MRQKWAVWAGATPLVFSCSKSRFSKHRNSNSADSGSIVACSFWHRSQGGYISAFLTTSTDRFAAICVGGVHYFAFQKSTHSVLWLPCAFEGSIAMNPTSQQQL